MLAVLQFNINGLNARKEELLKIVKTKTLSFIGIQELRTESENTREKVRKALSNMDYNIIYHTNVALIYHKSFKLINNQIKDKEGRITGGLFQKEKVIYTVYSVYAPTFPRKNYKKFKSFWTSFDSIIQ
jgi:exonuclease III